jgi:cyclohexanone monooxygenase
LRSKVDAVVIGAGFSGLYMLYRLRDLGLTVRGFERGADVGGTWYWNRYPGARCDSESLEYCYSFDTELYQEWQWRERWPSQPEILDYLRHVADRYDLRGLIRFNTVVIRASFDAGSSMWSVESDDGEQVFARYLISAVGCLSAKRIPRFPGLESFAGDWYHSGAWPLEGVDLAGKRVGLIGTGCTGIQMVPEIAREAASLLVFQRTANFSVPSQNAALDREREQEVKAGYPAYRERGRWSPIGAPSVEVPSRSALEDSPEQRRRRYEELWQIGGSFHMELAYNDLLRSEEANETAAEFVREKIREIVDDQDTADLLCPYDHPFATKRLPQDIEYFETFNRENVTLVDVRSAPIAEITTQGVRLENGDEHGLDLIVFATGFDAMTGALLEIDIRGRDGVSLREQWEDGPQTYLGLQVAGFPNLFLITGPGSPSVLTNMPVAIEQHVEWIADALAYLEQNGCEAMEATAEGQATWMAEVKASADATLLPRAASWWMGANVPGKPRVFMPYPGGLDVYRRKCQEIAANGYEGFLTLARNPASHGCPAASVAADDR